MQESACARTRRQGGMRPTLTPEARVLRALAHPERLAIVECLRHGSVCVCHLTVALGRPQAYISQQLATLKGPGGPPRPDGWEAPPCRAAPPSPGGGPR